MNPAGYYTIDLAAVRALPRAEALALLDDIRLHVTSAVGAERARIAAAEVDTQAAAGGERGAQNRAAAVLNMTPARLGQLYADHKEHSMAEPTVRIRPDHALGLAMASAPIQYDPGNPYGGVLDSLTRKYNAATASSIPADERRMDVTRGELVCAIDCLRHFHRDEAATARKGYSTMLETYQISGVGTWADELQRIYDQWDEFADAGSGDC